MLDGDRPVPSLRGTVRDTTRAPLFLRELGAVLLACGHSVAAENFQKYAIFTVTERNTLPRLGETFYDTGLAAFQKLVRTFLEQAEREGILTVDDLDGAAWGLLSLVCGCVLLRSVVTGHPIPPSELAANVHLAVDTFTAALR